MNGNMAKVFKTSGGAWLDKEKLTNNDVIKLVSEAVEEESKFGMQLVAQAKVKGWDNAPEKVSINTLSKNALIDAFGDDTAQWVGKVLTVNVVETTSGGRSGISLYLIPDGYVRVKDAGGYNVIQPKLQKPASLGGERSPEEVAEGIDVNDIPF